MFDFLDLKIKNFSLAINEFALRLVKIKTGKKSFSVASFGELELKSGIIKDGVVQDEPGLTDAIKQIRGKVKGEKLKTKYVVVSLPEEESFSQVIQMPKMNQDELRMAISLEAESYIPIPMDKVYFDFKIIAPIKDGTDHLDVLIVAMSQKIVDSYISCIKRAGLIPVAIEIESQGIARALIKNETSDYPIILIDFNEDRPNFIIFSGNSVRFASSASFSSEEESAGGSNKNTKIGAVERLTGQIEKYTDFYKSHASHEHIPNDSTVKKVILCGGGRDLKKIANSIAKDMEIEAEAGDPFINFPKNRRGSVEIPDPSQFTTALGLSLRDFPNQKKNHD